MTSKKTAYIPFCNMLRFYIFVHCRIQCLCQGLVTLMVVDTNGVSNQIPLSEQNIFSNDMFKILKSHLYSSDSINHTKLN